MPARAALKTAYSVNRRACWIWVSWMAQRMMKIIAGSTNAASTIACPLSPRRIADHRGPPGQSRASVI